MLYDISHDKLTFLNLISPQNPAGRQELTLGKNKRLLISHYRLIAFV